MKRPEPYEVMPEGEEHATADWITTILASLMLLIIIFVLAACPAQAEEQGWCAAWVDGYQIGYCWSRAECDYIPPAICPYPLDGETDGYMRGLKDGLKDGRDKK